MVSLVCLAWARDIVAGFLSIFGVHRDAKAVSTVAIVFAVFFIYVLDFSINVGMCGPVPSILYFVYLLSSQCKLQSALS